MYVRYLAKSPALDLHCSTLHALKAMVAWPIAEPRIPDTLETELGGD